MATATSMDYVQKIFIAYLGRGASTEALETWGNAIDEDQEGGKEALFYNIWKSDEAGLLYDGTTQTQKITLIFQNAFERDPAQAGIDAWIAALDAGEVNEVSLAAAIVDSADAAGAATYALKNEAADYYRTESDKAGRDFVATESKSAVDPVDSPNSLVDSKAETDATISGVGSTITLTTDDDTITMTGGDDVVTGTLGVGATYDVTGAGDAVVDGSTTDEDVLTINSTDALTTTQGAVVMGTVTNVETVNVNFNSQLGTAQTLDLAKVGSGTDINIDANEFVTVAGIDNVIGATIVGVTNSKANIAATDVTTLSVDMDDTVNNDTAFTISADADATVVSVGDIDDGGVTLTLGNDTATNVLLSGGDGTNDSVTISANNAVALNLADANDAGTQDVDIVSLSGNTNDVNFTITNASSDAQYTVTGSKDVTLTGAASMFSTTSLTDSSTGTITVDVTGAGVAADLSAVNADVVDLSGDVGATVTFNDSQDVTISSTQAGLTLAQGNGNDGTVTATLDMGAATSIADVAITATGFAAVTLNTGDVTVTSGSFTGTADDTDYTLVGTNDINFDGVINVDTGDVTVSGKKVNIDALITGANIDIDATNDVDLTGITASKGVDIVSAGNFNTTATVAAATGDGNDVSIKAVTVTVTGAVDVTGDDITIEATNDTTASAIGRDLVAANDVTLNGGNLDVARDVTATAGSVTVTAGDVDITGDLAAAKNITISGGDVAAANVTATAGVLTVSGTAGLVVGTNTTAVGGVVITSANDVDLGTLAGQTTVINGSTATGKLTVTTAGTSGNVTLVSGAGNDVLGLAGGDIHNVQSGDGVDQVTISKVGAQSVVNTGGGADIINVNEVDNDVTLSTGDGNDVINVTHGASLAVAIDGGGDSDTLVLETNKDYKGTDLSFSNIEVIDLGANNVTISAAQLAGDNTFEVTADAASKVLTVDDESTDGDAAMDLSGVSFDIAAVATTVLIGGADANVITGSDSADVITGLAGNDTISTGEGVDSVDGGEGIDTVTLGDGIDTVKFTDVRLAADGDTVKSFTVGTDIIGLEADNTLKNTAAGAAAVVEDEATVAANANNTAYDLTAALAGNSNDVDLVTLDTAVLANIANADLSAATDGTELLKALVAAGAGNTASAIDVVAKASVYILTDDATDGYLYYANDTDADGLLQADEIILVGTFDAAQMDGVVAAQTIMV